MTCDHATKETGNGAVSKCAECGITSSEAIRRGEPFFRHDHVWRKVDHLARCECGAWRRPDWVEVAS